MERGQTVESLDGFARETLENMEAQYNKDTRYYLYRDFIFIFAGMTFITVIGLKSKLESASKRDKVAKKFRPDDLKRKKRNK